MENTYKHNLKVNKNFKIKKIISEIIFQKIDTI